MIKGVGRIESARKISTWRKQEAIYITAFKVVKI